MNDERPSGFVPLPDEPFGGSTPPPKARPAQPAIPTPAPAPPPPAPPSAPVDGVCPYCAATLTNAERCEACKGLLDPLSRQASQNAMGPWALFDPARSTMPGCSFETLRAMVPKGRVRRDSVLRGPTTRQFWMRADRVPGVAVLLGVCHACAELVRPDQETCQACGAELHVAPTDRQHLGLVPVADLPGAAPVRTEAPAPEPDRDVTIHKREVARWRQRSRALGIVVVFLSVSLLSVGGILLWRELGKQGYSWRLPGDNQANTTVTTPTPQAPPPTTTPTRPTAARPTPVQDTTPPDTDPTPPPSNNTPLDPALVGLDPALAEWHEDLRRAHALALSTELADIERAIQLLERVLDEATRDLDDADGRFPLLRARLVDARATADRLFAEATLGG